MAAEPPSPYELLPSICDVRVAWNDQSWSDMIHHSSTPGLSLAVWSPFAAELPLRQAQLQETTRSLPFQCCFPAKILQILPTRSLVSLSTALSIMPWQCLGLGTKPKVCLGQDRATIPQFVDKLLVCKIIHGRISCSADCSEHCSIAPKTFDTLALKPPRNPISFPGSWQTMTMRLGRPVYAQPCLSDNWQ